MRIVGFVGGISWISTAAYYQQINEEINKRLGGLNFAHCIIYSFNYENIKKNNDTNNWESTFEMVSKACQHLTASGAEAIVLCANTMHLIADRLQAVLTVPIIRIGTATATEIEKRGLKKVGLLGTKFTMEMDFIKTKLIDKGIESIIPDAADRQFIHDTIGNELGKGIITENTKVRYLQIIQLLVQQGAEGIILGCTEIPLLIKQEDVSVPVFDTTLIHSHAAVHFALH